MQMFYNSRKDSQTEDDTKSKVTYNVDVTNEPGFQEFQVIAGFVCLFITDKIDK